MNDEPYVGGFDIALNHDEIMASFPDINQHGTSNPTYEDGTEHLNWKGQGMGTFNLKYPTTPKRVAVLFYLMKYMAEIGGGDDWAKKHGK